MYPQLSGSRVVSRSEYLDRLQQARRRPAANSASVAYPGLGDAGASIHTGPRSEDWTRQVGSKVRCAPLAAVGGLVAGDGSIARGNSTGALHAHPDFGHGHGYASSGAGECSRSAHRGPGGVEMQLLANQSMLAPGVSGAARGDYGGAPKSRTIKDNFVNRVVQRCGPAVVRVETEQKVEMPGLDNSDVFSFFFGMKPDTKKRERSVHSHGSGFCIDAANGVILTNAHVVQGADRIKASFPGRNSPLECEVLETDEVIDLAAIRVKERPSKQLPSMQLGSSESVLTGDWAIVLGNPFGLQNTCTLGIVSSLDRSTGETGFDWMRHPLMQTDAAVNQGNSGGPMLNEAGEVIGMISMRALFGEGIGFAIPADSIKSALGSLLQRKKVPRAYLGLKMSASAPGSDDGARSREGAYVEVVLPRSPAQTAGFEVEDQILEIEGRKVRHFEEVQSAVRAAKVGSRLTFKVKREGQSRNVTVETADIRDLRKEAESKAPRHRVVILQ